jgi:predicted ATPase/GAF domain-containing protein/HPt (histidine-containing phosphotransfer) domain-containing protein
VHGNQPQYRIEALPLSGKRRVFAATRLKDEAHFVVKRPRPGYPPAEEAAALRHEFAVLSRLRGAPVVEALELIEGAELGLVLALAPGRPLDAIIEEGRPEVLRCVSLAVAMTKALAAVHARGFAHRDVKPDHFFIEEQSGTARLVDFGLATQLVRERRAPAEPDEITGTLAYISPEQTGRTSHSIDQRSDLYSLGATLYELFTGRRPFQTDDPLELIHAHVARQPAALRHHRPDLPPVLEALVLRLLAKDPRERYQTAAGLLADLERASAELSSTGTVTPFSLGQHDYDGTLRLPEKLYGRAASREALLKRIRDTKSGARALVLLSGPPGVGKSALVDEAHRQVVRGGHFVTGKFDQYSRGIPYSALANACSQLVRVYLASSPSELEAWRSRLRLALGDNARVVADIVPELLVALGEQPEVAPLPPNETQTRFERTFRRFMEASACQQAPLVLFLDDLQWADTASLAVLELILASDSQGHLLVIGSYRDTEVDAAHPLTRMRSRLEQRVEVEHFPLAPLGLAEVQELLADALPRTRQSRAALASLVHQKTSGNPFFIGQFLERLAAEGLLEFEPGQGYAWDLDAISSLEATDNVVDLVVARLGALPPRTRELLRLAACFGHTFRIQTLSVIAEEAPRAVLQGLLPAVMGGYLVPLGADHRLLDGLVETPEGVPADASYRFAHDRVQQAALGSMDASERSWVHLRIGRLLLSAAGADGPSEDQLFEVLTQLNLGRRHLETPAEKLALARLNLRGARKARGAAAHASAVQLAEYCLELLGPQPFVTDRECSQQAHLVAAESSFLLHDEARALQLVEAVEANAVGILELVPARNLAATIITNQGRPREATAISVRTLAELGVRLPDIDDPQALGAAIGEAFGSFQMALGARDVASLFELPAMKDPEKLALAGVFACAIPSVFQWNPSLMVLLVLQAVRLPLEHGTAAVSPFFYAQYGIVHHVVTGDPVRAHEFGLLALALAERPEHAPARGGVEFIYAEFLAPWVRPRAECAAHFERGVSSGLDAGDQLHAGYCMAVGLAEALYAGRTLPELREQTPPTLKALHEQGDVLNHLLVEMVGRGVASLCGQTSAAGSMDGDGFSEQKFEAEAPPPVTAHYGAIKAMLRFLFGDPAEARRISEVLKPPPGVTFKVEYVFYHGVSCVELARGATETAERDALLAQADRDLASFEPWVRDGRRNFFTLAELLRAELAAARGDTLAALDAYDRAVEAASAHHHLALAHELTARFHLRVGRRAAAQLSVESAARNYELWGATGKVRQLRDQYPGWLASAATPLGSTASYSSGSSSSGGRGLDLESAMRAVNAIASEIRLEPLLRRLTQILAENAGATRGLILLPEQDEFVVRAALDVRTERDGAAPAAGPAFAPSVVRYCSRTLQSVVLDDASRDNRFAQDARVEGKAMSLVCVPLVHQGQLVGVLYLENDTATGVFNAARVARLEFLAGHAAVSLQNARLYDELQAVNENLERRVRERTAELSTRNRDMRRVLDNVKQGLLTIDLEGRLAPEHSRVVDEWLGHFEPNQLLSRYLEGVDARFVERFRPAYTQLLEGELPEEVALDQLPTTLVRGPRSFQLSYEPIRAEGAISGLLIVIDDVTGAMQRAREEADQKDVLSLCRHLSKDRGALLTFFDEAQSLVDDLSRSSKVDATLKRNLHTLKGNAALYGFESLSESCHTAEDAIAEDALKAAHLEEVTRRFETLRASLTSIAGDNAAERVEVSRATLRSLAERLSGGMRPEEAAGAVERLLLEPVRPSLERLAKYGRDLAARLGKAEPRVEIADGGSFVEGVRAAPLFASLVHLIRNAVDHGLETAAERSAAGKPAPVLSVRAHVEGGEVVITVGDDGRGVDWEKVRARAASRGLPAATPRELAQALFSPELSTREAVSDISGRGVGLTALHAEVARLGGHVTVESQPGLGARFHVHIPTSSLGAR